MNDFELPTEAPDDKDVPQEDSIDGDPFKDNQSEQRAWDEHKDECNGCSLCEL